MFVERYQREGQTWTIGVDGTALTIVEEGVERIEQLVHSFPAYGRFQELTSAKERDGWTRVEEVDPSAPVIRNARNPELEVPLLENPYDRAAWVVYGDWLQQQGDPRGEYIALHAAWHADPGDAFAPYLLHRCVRRHRDYFVGRLHHGQLGMGGFVDEIELTQYSNEVLRSPDARFVTEVSIRVPWLDETIAGQGSCLPATIRKLSILGSEATGLEALEPTLDRLHALYLRVPLTAQACELLARHAFPKLERLGIDTMDDKNLPRALLEQELPSLESLSTHSFGIDAALMTAISRAPYAARLRRMTLYFLDDPAARVLIDSRDRFPALEELTVEDYRMSPEIQHELWQPPWKSVLQFCRSNSVYYPD